MVGAPPPTPLHGHLPLLVNLISSLFHCLSSFSRFCSFVPLQSPSLCSQAHAFFYKLSKEFFNRLGRFCDALNDRFENETGQARAVAHALHFEISITRSCEIWPE